MRKAFLGLLFLAILAGAALVLAPTLAAADPQWVTVSPGDTLFGIAARNGTTIDVLMRLNNLPNPNFVYSGQRLMLPETQGTQAAPASNKPAAPTTSNNKPSNPASVIYYTVRPGDTLPLIADRFGVPTNVIAEGNGIANSSFVFSGQRLRIPGARMTAQNPVLGAQPPAPLLPLPDPKSAQTTNPPAVPVVEPPTTGKWIDVNVSDQTIAAYDGATLLKTLKVSTGLPRTPTVLGQFKIYRKYPAVRMTGGTPGIDYYDLPNVPWTMFFYQGYAIHGTYWHTNFGHPMSHGCVNLPTDQAKWFYEWAPQGTLVVTHK